MKKISVPTKARLDQFGNPKLNESFHASDAKPLRSLPKSVAPGKGLRCEKKSNLKTAPLPFTP